MEVPAHIRARYEVLLGSDVVNDGMFLELWDPPGGELALWAFYSDATHQMKFKRYREVPSDVEAWFKRYAQSALAPKSRHTGE